MAIDHGADLNNFDPTQFLNLLGEGASLGITLTATITDGDNDTATSSATIEIAGPQQSSIGFQDDGPSIDVTVQQPEENSAHLADAVARRVDRRRTAAPTVFLTEPSTTSQATRTLIRPAPIRSASWKTAAGEGDVKGDLEALFDVTKIAGTDGEKSTHCAYSFALSGAKETESGGIATTLKVTDPNHDPTPTTRSTCSRSATPRS